MTKTVLRIDSLARIQGSVTRSLTDQVLKQLAPEKTITRDIGRFAVPQINEAWVTARIKTEQERDPEEAELLEIPDMLVAELQEADKIVIGLPIYNFSAPAALKAWIDQIARVGITFRYTDDGPIGLLKGKRAIIVMASGGVPQDSRADLATPYPRYVLNFVGITNIEVVAADRQATDPEGAVKGAQMAITTLAA
ncbi:MAG: NAD(P)H-dependent oxidoreductase [Paracoccaceae bacterium]|nr:NAD(P)H-dependent oxidoreductase [Paracoccaceae bacterium]